MTACGTRLPRPGRLNGALGCTDGGWNTIEPPRHGARGQREPDAGVRDQEFVPKYAGTLVPFRLIHIEACVREASADIHRAEVGFDPLTDEAIRSPLDSVTRRENRLRTPATVAEAERRFIGLIYRYAKAMARRTDVDLDGYRRDSLRARRFALTLLAACDARRSGRSATRRLIVD